MRAGLLLIALLGCGSSQKPQNTPPPPPTPPADAAPPTTPPPPVAGEATAQQICHRILELKDQKCQMFANANFDEAGCMKELESSADDPMIKVFTGCVMQPSCEEVQNCVMAAAQNAQAQQDLRACNDTASMSPVGIPKAEWDNRNGAKATKFSQVVSTKDKPVEMCGVPAENEWLESLTCDDGSKPFGNAENVRAGNVGSGGRCGSIIDQYVVKCPGGKTYPIFIDAYVCPRP